MDEPQPSLPASRLTMALARITALGGLLTGIFGVFAGLVLFGEIGAVAALVAFLVITAGVAILPAGTVTITRAVEPSHGQVYRLHQVGIAQ